MHRPQPHTTIATSRPRKPVKLFSGVLLPLDIEECASKNRGCGILSWRTGNRELVWEYYGLPPYCTVKFRKGWNIEGTGTALAPGNCCSFVDCDTITPHRPWTPCLFARIELVISARCPLPSSSTVPERNNCYPPCVCKLHILQKPASFVCQIIAKVKYGTNAMRLPLRSRVDTICLIPSIAPHMS